MIDPDEVRAAAEQAEAQTSKAAEAANNVDEYSGTGAYAVASAMLAVAEQLRALRLATVDVVERHARQVKR